MKHPLPDRRPETNALSRRAFLSHTAAAGAVLACAPSLPLWGAAAAPKRPLVVFSKAFQHLNFEETADLVAEVGWDGIECPVRKGGQVLPERVEEDLPKMVEALNQRGKALAIATTDVRGVTPLNEKVLRTAAKLGVKLYRLSYWRYDFTRPIPDQLDEIKAQLKDIAAMNKELGVCGGIQNHSGTGYVGAPVWDIHELIKDLDPAHLSVFFDIAHATVEGGNAWQIHAKLMEPRFKSIYLKDFFWQKGGKTWAAKWCPLGQGMVNRTFVEKIKNSPFAGPISHHVEFEIGKGEEMKKALQADFATLKNWLG
jgi:sugar phosphate isomerase/epimerase